MLLVVCSRRNICKIEFSVHRLLGVLLCNKLNEFF